MEAIANFSGQFAGAIWGMPMVFVLIGAGILFSVYFFFPQFRLSWHAIQITMGKFDKPEDKGEISHFQALCAALSATIGLGNIAGVAVAIAAGGPGAIFWMWLAGFIGMTTKLASISLSMIYREEHANGHFLGGPMYTIKNGLGKSYAPLAWAFSFFTIAGAIGAGNMFQSNQMAGMIKQAFSIPDWATGIVFTILTFMVLVGGIKRIGNVASKLVPAMVVIYFAMALGIIFTNISEVPSMIGMIFKDAFTGTAAIGGFGGVAFKEVVVQGVRRALFSNEAGLGSAAMAHTAAKSKPVQEGLVGMLGPFIDTVVVCTITALVLLLTGAWKAENGLAGAELTAWAFSTLYGNAGTILLTIVVVLFAFSSIISWSYYGEMGVAYIFGEKFIPYYRWVFTAFVFLGAITKLDVILNFSDAFLGLMVVPNLVANIMLMPRLKKDLKQYEADLKAQRI